MEQNNKKTSELVDTKIVETYAEDMAQVISDNKEGLIKKIIHQAEEREVEDNKTSPEAQKNKIFGILGMILIISTFVILIISGIKKENQVVEITKQFSPLIFNDKNIFVELPSPTKEKLNTAFLNAVNDVELKTGEVEGIYFTENKEIFGLKKFLKVIQSNLALPEINNSGTEVVSDNFLTGVVVNGIKKDFFMLIKVRSIQDVFNNIHTWENKMFADLHDFLGVNITSTNSYLLTKDFEDGIVENKNARILYEGTEAENKKIVLMYVFANDNSIIITNSVSAASEVMSRMTSSKIKQ